MSNVICIAVDGPSGAGKSTVAKAVGAALGVEYIDTGAMYRAVGYGMVQRGIGVGEEDREKLEAFLQDAEIDFRQGKVHLNGEDVSGKIRTPEISRMASDCSALAAVRAKLVAAQREMGRKKSVIMDGRDIGPNVFPDAKYKYFLTASAEERARRRLLELEAKYEAEVAAKGAASMEKPEFEQVLADMKQRDYNDSHRALNPLTKAEDAVEIDSTHMNIGQVIDFILDRVAE
ncbi:MAG: (d)CMP kinase [Firmicutes bacterium]|nr:(d)CMP kinase [Bacillota bacterium]